MPQIRIFNPEHDLALAFGGTNYTPPPMARLLRRDLQMLPYWIAKPQDSILTENVEVDSEWLNTLNRTYNTDIYTSTIKDIDKFDKFEPWGWNRFLWHRLQLDGVPAMVLPPEETIKDIRALSHRRISIKIHELFHEYIPSLPDNTPEEIDNLENILCFARRHPNAYVKAPWSSSGKGIYRALDIDTLDFIRRCSGILKRQGSVLCEKPLDAITDFAMEFSISSGKTEFIGYSLFNNDTHSSFSGGLLQSTPQLHRKIAETLGNEKLLYDVKMAAQKILDTLIAPHYNGYAGIDMMIYRDSANKPQINPCIELNLRTTMGVVSSIIGNKLLAEGSTGLFQTEFHKSVITRSYINSLENHNKLRISDNGKIISGVQMLTPLYPSSQYCAYIKVSSSR